MVRVLFVCTGNICRSAMAEGIARHRGPDAGQIEFASAGTWPITGPATDEAIAAAAEIGVDIRDHRAQDLRSYPHVPDRVYGMTGHHVRAAEAVFARAELLDPDGVEIDDPYGGTMADYRRARDAIVRAIEVRAERDWEPLV